MNRKVEDKKVDIEKARNASHTFLLMKPRVEDRFEHRVRHVEIGIISSRLSGLIHDLVRSLRSFPRHSRSPSTDSGNSVGVLASRLNIFGSQTD